MQPGAAAGNIRIYPDPVTGNSMALQLNQVAAAEFHEWYELNCRKKSLNTKVAAATDKEAHKASCLSAPMARK